MEKIVSYDQVNDILFVHNGYKKEEKFKGNIDIGDFILDISSKGNVRGIEILNASENLKQFKITKNILLNLKDANLIVEVSKSGVIIVLKFISFEKELPFTLAVPLENYAIA